MIKAMPKNQFPVRTPTGPNVDSIPRPAMPSMPQRTPVGTPNAIPRPAIPQRPTVGTPNAIPRPGLTSTMPGVNKPLMMPAGSGVGKAPAGTMGRLAKGGKVSSASKRADGCAVRGKTKGRMV